MNHTAFLLLGSNLGDKTLYLKQAIDQIEAQIGHIVLQSGVYETAPWGVQDQPSYLNQVLQIKTNLVADDVLKKALDIEKKLGRERLQRWEQRTIDIDLLYYNDAVINTKHLTVPHPRLQERRFTLVPLVEIAPLAVHPTLLQTNTELLKNCKDLGNVVLKTNLSTTKIDVLR